MTAASPLLLGLDLGTSRLKAALVDRAGQVRRVAAVPTPFHAVDGGIEMTAGALHDRLGELFLALGPERRRVAAVGIASMGESGAPLDADGTALGPIIAWHDPRGREAAARIAARFGSALSRRTGQPPRSVSSIAKLGWLHDHGLPPPRRWLGVAELCGHWLTGQAATDPSLASRTGCFDIERRCYLRPVAAALGLADVEFPPVRPAGSPAGRVTAAGAAWAGLGPGTVVTIAGHDHLVGADGCGAGPGDLVDSIGTAEALLRYVSRLPPVGEAVAAGIDVSVHPDGRRWVLLVGCLRPGVILGQAAEALRRPADELHALAGSRDAVAAAAVEPWLDGLVSGRPCPPPAGHPGAVWRGLLLALTRRAVLESSRLERFAGAPGRVLVIGRGATSPAWVAAKAQLHPEPVLAVSVPEAVARGSALHAGVAAGWWPTLETAPPPAG